MSNVIVENSLNSFAPQSQWLEHVWIGMRLDVQLLDHHNSRFHSELIGYRLGRFILVRFDEQALPPKLSLNGLVAVCRFLVEDSVGECYAFKSHILNAVRLPDKLLFLSFPTEIHRRPLRTTRRVSISIPASIQLRTGHDQVGKAYDGLITDISQVGCRFRFAPNHKGHKVNLLPVQINLHGQEGLPPRQLQGSVRNSKMEDTGLCVGIKFDEVQPDFDETMWTSEP
ncbi:PilZ domain-containing protein [Shewanella salipaludis]|uniref:Flagellar brake protein n=1 Tax=Shewanella salipaludis TaxID=2723052 RepID=A0A972JLN1_9GAMM|nr:PilZ domain-containing protein [Shewanella salipaludis]NMH65632.1 flagellar brake protein [Shewanella salipaludis]